MLGAIAHSSDTSPKPADADREHAPLAVQVAERAADQDQRAEREQVGVGDPLLTGEPAAEVGADGRQRDVHGGRVEPRDEPPMIAAIKARRLRRSAIRLLRSS